MRPFASSGKAKGANNGLLARDTRGTT